VIPPQQNSHFVAAMEQVLDVYKRPYNKSRPVVCMDETPKQLIKEVRKSLPIIPGFEKRVDYEYSRSGVCNVFMVNEPLAGKRFTKVTGQRTKTDWAQLVRYICDKLYPNAETITLVMDNLASHSAAALYETFEPVEAKRIWDRLEFVYTPKHGSWLNMAEIELNVLTKQCLCRRIDNLKTVKTEVKAWQNHRNNKDAKIKWQFTTKDARVKLHRLYPSIHN
jgi:transposase